MSLSNLYAQFRRLLPAPPLLVGEVISSGSGIVLVELPGGDRITVRGEGTVSTAVFVRNGVVEGPAPSLAGATIEI